MIRAWRICRAKWAATAFTGDGAKAYAGRWNSAGTAIVYTADSPASAVLELLVHIDSDAARLGYVFIPVDFDERLVELLDQSLLPRKWRDFTYRQSLRALGDAWIASGRGAVLKVPSVIVPHTCNYLINPVHRGFADLKIGKPEACPIDGRVKN